VLTAGQRSAQRHGYAHELGRRSLGYAGGDVAVAFAACDPRFHGGCYDGVMDAFVATQPARVDADLPVLCDRMVLPPDSAPQLRSHCYHGIGHGLAAADPQRALAGCDRLADARGRQDCYGGVFMDRLQAGDPARCDQLGEAYREQCYLLAPAASLQRNGGDMPSTLSECERVPAVFVAACFYGAGRDIASIAAGDVERAHELCAAANPADRSFCRAGTVSLLVSDAGEVRPGLDYCAVAPAADRPACFVAVGELLAALQPRAEDRAAGCATVAPADAAACRRGAGLAP
jgi:hypothetical protein